VVNKRFSNVLMVGNSGEGKSSLINSFGRLKLHWETTRIDVGRTYMHGSEKYKSYGVSGLGLKFFDTAGRKWGNSVTAQISQSDKTFVAQLVKGLKAGVSLMDDSWITAPGDTENKIDCIIIVVGANSLIVDRTHNVKGGWFEKDTTTTTKEVSTANIGYLPSLYEWCITLMNKSPLVVITKMDEVPNSLKSDVVREVGRFVHQNNVFPLSNWVFRQRDLDDDSINQLNTLLQVIGEVDSIGGKDEIVFD